MRMRNLTLHRQDATAIEIARSAGFELDSEPEGVEAGQGRTALMATANELAAKLAQCREQGHAALVGGSIEVVLSAVVLLMNDHDNSRYSLPSIHVFQTESGPAGETPIGLLAIPAG